MNLSIVITTRDRLKDLLACVASVRSSNLEGLDLELIVVDDASSDGTKLLRIEDLNFPKSKIIHLNTNSMMVASRNIGGREAKGDFILFLDDDNEVDSAMIKVLLNFGQENPEYGILGPSNYYFDTGEKYMDYQKISLCTSRTAGVKSDKKTKVLESDGIPNVFMVNKEVFTKCGYFDERLIQTFTEPDFAAKAKIYGYKCGVLPEAKTYHKVKKVDDYKPRSMGGMFSQKAYCLMRNRAVYISRYGTFFNKLIYIVFFSLFWPIAYSLLALKNGRKDLIGLYWRGFFDGLRYFFTGRLINSMARK